MSDLIDRQAAIDALESIGSLDTDADREYARGIFNALPSAEPQRKKGKWIRHDEVKNVYGGICIECPECGEKYVVQYIEDEKYCRNCGADMRG